MNKKLITLGMLLGATACGRYSPVDTAEDLVNEDTADTAIYDTGLDYGLEDTADTGLDDTVEEVEMLGCTDLTNYPDCYVTDGRFNGYFVVGVNAPSLDSISMTDIATNMMYTNGDGENQPVEVVDSTRLDSVINDYAAQNLVSIGMPCENTITADVLNTSECSYGLDENEALIELSLHDTGYTTMTVRGYDSEMTRVAAKVIANRPNDLEGRKILVSGTEYETASLTVLDE